MKKIRINELARELEVKPHKIIELLPEMGVTEKKTHSSSIDEDVALQVRHRLVGTTDTEDDETSPARPSSHDAAEQLLAPPEDKSEAASHILSKTAGAVSSTDQPPVAGDASLTREAAAEAGLPGQEVRQQSLPAHQPIRPPLAGASGTALHPPLSSRPAPGTVNRSISVPARPLPAFKPGQILTGPRQPLPSGEPAQRPTSPLTSRLPSPVPGTVAASHPPAAQVAPGHASPTMPRPLTPKPPALPTTTGTHPRATPAAPSPLRPPARPNLAGQPSARPIVPPRADLVARLSQTQAKALPGQPLAPRPGPPSPQASPVPGRPIYQGSIRPGQPLMRGPGAPGPGLRSPRQRPLHPTSPLRAEPSGPMPPPTEQQRRHQAKPAGRPLERTREEREERMLRLPSVRRSQPVEPPPIDREITVSEGITLKELSEKLGVKANMVIRKLVERKIFATINQTLDVKLAEELSRDFGASTNKVSYEEETTQEIELAEDTKDLMKRAPVVTIMGHVDHGKTSLLDAIRITNVAEREAGGITQHIGAYHVEKNGRKIVFIDTPGHEAFTRMRARGAKVTDIVVLVVAADDGVMPQTLEAIDHAKAAKVPIIVAINKIDKADAQPERIKQQLADRSLLAEDWGGDVVMVPVSARAKQNLDLLLEMVLLVADLQDLKASPSRPAIGTVLEAQLDKGRGPVATVLVRNGTLKVGDFFICGSVFGKVRAMFDDRGQPVRDAEPSMPVEVIGLDSMPEVGDTFQVVSDTGKAKQIVIYRESKAREIAMSKGSRVRTLEQLHEQLKEGEIKELNVIVKTDVGGTAEVLTDTLQKLSNEKVRIRVLHSGVGAITETDVLLAAASEAIIIGFNVRPERNATVLAEQEKVDIRLHSIIYNLTDEIKRAMTGMLAPVYREVYKGRAAVRDVFRISKVGTVAGCMVTDGVITRDSEIRLLRDNVVVHTGKIETLKRFKNDASEVKNGFECGVALANFADIKPSDVIEAFVTERVATEAFL